MLDTYVPSDGQYFWQNAGLHQNGAIPYITRANRCPSYGMSPSSWTEGYGPACWPGRSSDLAYSETFPLEFVINRWYQIFLTSLWPLQPKITTAIRTVSQDILNDGWTNLENWLPVFIRELGGHNGPSVIFNYNFISQASGNTQSGVILLWA